MRQRRHVAFGWWWLGFAALAVALTLGACGSRQGAAPQVLATAGSAQQPGFPADWRYPPNVAAAQGPGMVVSDAPLATAVGAEILRKGGNAVDAAVATAFALAVVLPSAGNLGGGGFAVVHVAGQTYALDFREVAPRQASRDMYLDAAGQPTSASVTGHLAAGVPGSVAGLWALHQKFGKRPWAELVEPARRLAAEGFVVDQDFATFVGQEAGRLALFPASAALFLPEGRPLVAGQHWVCPELAATLEQIGSAGPAGFYSGPVAELLLAEMQRGGGILTAEDLATYQVKWREPVQFTYRGHRVASMPPPSSGGVTLAMIGHQLAQHDLQELGFLAPASLHLEAEAMRRAFAVRNEMLGDPDQVAVPTALLASPAFGEALGAKIDPSRATPSTAISGRVGQDGPHTTHFSVADHHGNAVALTTTLNASFGAAVTVPGAGFLLNNEMDDFAAKPGAPNDYGLVQGEANAIAPGKRMLSSMSPTIAFDPQGHPILITGASGGPFIITTVFQLLSARLDHDLGVAAAMSAPRFHHQHLPDRLALESGGFPPATRRALEQLGHQLGEFSVPDRGWTIAATIEWRDGRWWGFADPRIHGGAAGE